MQPNKYNNKPFIEMHGFDTYDFSARMMYPAIGDRFMSIDPLCEKYYSISPYDYCAGNPVNAIDPDGRDPRKLSDWWKFAKAVYNSSTVVITFGFQGAAKVQVAGVSVGISSNPGSFDLIGFRNGNFTPNKNTPVIQTGGELSLGIVSISANTTKTDNGATTTVEKKTTGTILTVEKSQTTKTEIDNTTKQTIKTTTQNDIEVPEVSIKVGLIIVPEIIVNTEKVAAAINNLINK